MELISKKKKWKIVKGEKMSYKYNIPILNWFCFINMCQNYQQFIIINKTMITCYVQCIHIELDWTTESGIVFSHVM